MGKVLKIYSKSVADARCCGESSEHSKCERGTIYQSYEEPHVRINAQRQLMKWICSPNRSEDMQCISHTVTFHIPISSTSGREFVGQNLWLAAEVYA
jgi:hypothetical protein